jgi:capsular exopolysaccharide synthesis family protein
MRSYPLLQRVVQDLNFEVSYFTQGDFKKTEIYLPDFPLSITPVAGSRLPYGKSFILELFSENEFSISEEGGSPGRFPFNDTVSVSHADLLVLKRGSLKSLLNRKFIVHFNDPYSLAKQYSARLNLEWATSGSGVVKLSLTGTVPQKEKDFLDRFITFYQRYDIDKKQTIASKSIDFLDRQVGNISDSLRYYEDRIAYQELHQSFNREQNLERLSSLGETLESQEMELRLKDRYFTYLEDYLRNENSIDQVILPSALGITDPIMGGLVSKLVEVQFEVRLLKDQMDNNNNPLVRDVKDRISQYKRDIYEAIRSARDIMKVNRGLYNERVGELQKGMMAESDPEKKLSNVVRNYKMMETLYAFLIQKRAEAAISRASTTSDIIVINHPEAGGPITPLPMTNYLYAIALGLLLPFGIFVLMEFFNTSVQSKEDIEAACTVPVIGTIGHKSTESNFAALEKPRSYLAESFRALRSNLNYFTEGKDKKVILITSSISGEGKSFTSINLSTVIAFSGKKVILIAGDMRKAEISRDFEVSNRRGLSLYLSGQIEKEEMIEKTKVENLDFVPPGPMPPNPAELYLGERIGQLFADLLKTYDYVIVDSPPVGLVSDALSLIPVVDHVLFVTRQGYTPLSAISQLQFMVDQGQVQHVSIVLNDITRIGMGYGYKYGYAYDYGYGYKYGQSRYFGKGKSTYGDDIYYQES